MPRLRDSDASRRRSNQFSADFSEALFRGLKIVTAFDLKRRQMTLSDISRLVELPQATVRRSLHTLIRLGFVAADGPLFVLTPNVLHFATAYRSSSPLIGWLQPLCESVSAKTSGLCSAAVLDGEETVMIARAAPGQVTSIGMGLGYRVPAFCSALGRVLLAGLSDESLNAYFKQLTPVKQTDHTVVDKAILRKEVDDARGQGFAFVRDESVIGFQSLAVPIKDERGDTIAAINIGGSVAQPFDQETKQRYVAMLHEHLRMQRDR